MDDDEDYFPASVMRLGLRDGSKSITWIAWDFSVPYLFPSVQFLNVEKSKAGDGVENLAFVPYERLPEIAGQRFSWLDEVLSLVEAFPGEEHEALLARALQYEAIPLDDPSTWERKRRRWWPF